MAVKIETIQNLLDERKWKSCADLATDTLAIGEWKKEEKAFLHYACSRSLNSLNRHTTALQHAQYSACIAEEIGDYDLLGESLHEVAWAQHKIPGMEEQAVETRRRQMQLFPRYKRIRDQYLKYQYNLGVCLRAAGLYEEALEQFRRTYQEARERGDDRIAQVARTNAVWEALRIGLIQDAEKLIREAPTQISEDPWLHSLHLIDLAQSSLLKRNLSAACAYAMQAALRADEYPENFAQAMDVLHRVAEQSGELEAALVAMMTAKIAAEQEDQHELVVDLVSSIRNFALRHPEVVEKVMATIDQ